MERARRLANGVTAGVRSAIDYDRAQTKARRTAQTRDQARLSRLQAKDRAIRDKLAAHMQDVGPHEHYDDVRYELGPDGVRYAVSGDVELDAPIQSTEAPTELAAAPDADGTNPARDGATLAVELEAELPAAPTPAPARAVVTSAAISTYRSVAGTVPTSSASALVT